MRPTQGLTPGEGEEISGFGKRVPLVLALREIVPATYQFAYAPGLNLGALVDWQGGRPWHDVLNTVLSSQGLYANESGEVISIDRQ